jgi:hypothetical protein
VGLLGFGPAVVAFAQGSKNITSGPRLHACGFPIIRASIWPPINCSLRQGLGLDFV